MEKLEAMILEAPSALNFTVFLNLLAEKLHGEWTVHYCSLDEWVFPEVGSASCKSCAASARATIPKIMCRKRFRKPKKIIAPQAQPQVWRFEKYNFNWLTAQTALSTVRNQYSKQIMPAAKLVNTRLLISFKKYKHLKLCFAQPFWAKNVFLPDEKNNFNTRY